MEWVETTGKTLEEAKDAALDQLGVAEDDAEFEVVEEAKLGLFGRVRAEARVRARVRPTAPRPKDDRRDRRRRDQRKKSSGTSDTSGNGQQPDIEAAAEKPTGKPASPKKERTRGPERVPASTEGTPVEEEVGKQAEVARSFVAGLVEEFDLEADVAI